MLQADFNLTALKTYGNIRVIVIAEARLTHLALHNYVANQTCEHTLHVRMCLRRCFYKSTPVRLSQDYSFYRESPSSATTNISYPQQPSNAPSLLTSRAYCWSHLFPTTIIRKGSPPLSCNIELWNNSSRSNVERDVTQ